MFRWNNWSLAVPARHLEVLKTEMDRAPDPESVSQVAVTADYKLVPGEKTPALRFNRSYRFRCRAVDVAGNSLSLKEANETEASRPIKFLRAEALAPPTVLLSEILNPRKSPGEQ
jgi:hypothetical protein